MLDINPKYIDLDDNGNILLPNIKKIFLPDMGMEMLDGDLSGADAYVVAADSNCRFLLDFFANPKGKLYAYIASHHLQRSITSESPEYKDYKAVCHGSNYGLGLDKLCTMLNIPYDSAEKLQKYYFTLCPEIRKWQEKIVKNISTKGYITNCFGRRSWFLNKNDPTLQNKAFAFIPQSTVLDVINRGWYNIRNNLSLNRYLQYIENPNKDLLHKINQLGDKIDVLLQVHDSLVVQYPIELGPFIRSDIKKEMEIPLPYGITIQADYKISTTSYGDMKKVS
jgi:DNA polymerase-1